MLSSHFGRIFCCRKKPGFPLVSFLPAAKKDTAAIPCAGESLRLSCYFSTVSFFAAQKTMKPLQPAFVLRVELGSLAKYIDKKIKNTYIYKSEDTMMNNFKKLILTILCVAFFPVFVFIQCGNGQPKNDLPPEARQIIGQMESPDDETAKDVFVSLREQTLEKITANLLEENDNIVVIEEFTSVMKKYTSTIYTPRVQMDFIGEAERSNVRIGSNRSLTGAYTLIENDNVPDKTFEIIDAFSNDRLDEYIAGRNRIPKFSNSGCLITVIKNDSGNITVSNFKTR